MVKAKADEIILSYNDVVLRRQDLDILNGPYFLNDRIIEFYFSYLTSSFPSDDILLIPPSIAFWIKECPDIPSLKDFVEPLNLSQRKLIIFPINDNSDVSIAGGGSHWSLLAYYRDKDMFVHHDSNGGMNVSDSMKVYRSIKSYISLDATYIDYSGTPTQENGYDCGLYVTAMARTIVDWYLRDQAKDMNDLWFSDLKERITPSLVSNMRGQIFELVRSLMIEK